MPHDPVSGVYYEVHGSGVPLVTGLPWFASQRDMLGDAAADARDAFLAALSDRYAILVMDYPGNGQSRDIVPDDLSADRVAQDLLSVASHAGFDRFAYHGYSWSAAAGLQLAARTPRLTALAIGGWPPLDAPYPAIWAAVCERIGSVDSGAMRVLRSADQYRQWDAFYRSFVGHWDERASVEAIKCPRLVYFGGNGDLVEEGHAVSIASTIRKTRSELEQLGWRVSEIAGEGHEVGINAELVIPLLRPFLDEALA
ncbi:alpha/beta fold hydrolase [Sphingomonas sp. RB1R13]|uniref:alpha/beta fold hydrolase n=1 Tax=Sphingomonas sp. RB1R13 TaxID=3096159 RepID=UPI002FC6C7A2